MRRFRAMVVLGLVAGLSACAPAYVGTGYVGPVYGGGYVAPAYGYAAPRYYAPPPRFYAPPPRYYGPPPRFYGGYRGGYGGPYRGRHWRGG